MRPKVFHVLFFILSLGLASAAAQTPAPKLISKGVVNGSAVSLPKPAYPAAAKAVNASGTVSVQVTIDENGNVISATATSGHPLLQAAAVEAARQAKFKPTLLEGQPVKVSGIIVYNFVSQMTLTQIGYELAFAEKSMSLKNSVAASISGSLPADWKEEKDDLKALSAYLIDKKKEDNKAPEEKQEQQRQSSLAASSTDKPLESKEKFVIGGVNPAGYNAGQTLDEKSLDMLKAIESKIENRLTSQRALWSFRLGMVLGKISAEIENSENTRANIAEMDQLNAEAPAGLPSTVLLKVKEISDASRQNASDAERKEKLTPLIESLRNLKTN
jgi:TonB family protein